MQAQKLIETFNTRREDFWRKEHEKRRARTAGRVSPRNPIASDVNFDCAREMYYGVTNPLARRDPGIQGSERMADGKLAAAAARRYLEDLGFEVVDVETPIEAFKRDGRLVYTGIIDFALVFDGARVPVESKEVSDFVFEEIDSYEDLEHFWWTRKYRGQVLVYLLQRSAPEGILLLTCQGKLKPIQVVLDDHLDDAELALQLGEQVDAAVKAGTPPPFAKDPTTCRTCWAFGVICQPPIEEQGALFLDDPELLDRLRRRAQNLKSHQEYEADDKWIKSRLKATIPEAKLKAAKAKDFLMRAICGDFAVSIVKRFRSGYVVKDVEYAEVKIAGVAAAGKQEDVA